MTEDTGDPVVALMDLGSFSYHHAPYTGSGHPYSTTIPLQPGAPAQEQYTGAQEDRPCD